MTPGPEALLTHLPTACVFVTPEGNVSWANTRASSVLGRPLVGQRCGEVLAPIEVLREAVESGGAESKLSSGRGELELRLQVSRLDEGYLVAFQDITDFQRLRGERDRLMQLAAVGEVLPALLHELKNPLAAVRTAVEVMVEEQGATELGQQLQAVLNEIRRIGLVLDGVGRIKRELHSTRRFAIDQSVREVFGVLTPQAVSQGILMEAHVDSLPPMPFDASAMRAIAFNLLTNALHACRPGDVIRLRLSRTPAHLVLELTDSGVGMPPDVRARCTELFFTTKPRGSGIGLALVRDLISSVKGELNIASQPGSGTSIVIRLPLPAQG